jgi:large subunit ribosomal protein L22
VTGPKLNDGALLVTDDLPTTKAIGKYLRGSASKAREVLDLIRGLDVNRADEVLEFTTRDVAKDIRKVLASAIANAVHNDDQDADELFVLACYADEGPTLRRFRPRARGRATRIRKRTCHITIVVARLSDQRLEVLQNRQQAQSATGRRRAGTSAQSRRDRVARSRARAESLRGGVPEPAEVEGTALPEAADEELPEDTPAADVDVVDEAEVVAGEVEPAEAAEVEPVELAEGAVAAPEDGSIPDGYPIKGNESSMKYHVPGGRYYDVTIAEVFFDTAEHAEAAGYEAPAGEKTTDERSSAEGSASDETTRDEQSSAEGSASDEAASSAEGSASDEAESSEERSDEEESE